MGESRPHVRAVPRCATSYAARHATSSLLTQAMQRPAVHERHRRQRKVLWVMTPREPAGWWHMLGIGFKGELVPACGPRDVSARRASS